MIETERLILRAPAAVDRAPLHAMWADPRVMADLGPVKSAEDSDAAIARHAGYGDQGLGFRSVVQRSDKAVVGFCGLKPGAPNTLIADDIEAGWMLATPYWGLGYAREAMEAVLVWGWANTNALRIVAITAACNAKSRGLMTRLGMRHAPALDFQHPTYAEGDPLRSTVTYVIARPA